MLQKLKSIPSSLPVFFLFFQILKSFRCGAWQGWLCQFSSYPGRHLKNWELALEVARAGLFLTELTMSVGSCLCFTQFFTFPFWQVDWEVCPPEVPCCNEYGYCRTKVSVSLLLHKCKATPLSLDLPLFWKAQIIQEAWEQKSFRDCNGESNGIELPERFCIHLISNIKGCSDTWGRTLFHDHFCSTLF